MGKAGKVGRPRRSPLAFFMQACRTELRRRYPEVAVRGDVLSRACAQRWHSTSAQERALFEHLAQGWRGALKTKPMRDPLAPKRPLSAFFLFSSEQRPHVRARWPGLNYAETAKRLGEQWAALGPEQRQPFEAKAVVLRQNYRKKLAAYQNRGTGEGESPPLVGKGTIKVEAQQGGEEDPKEHCAELPPLTQESLRELKEEGPDTLALGGTLDGHNWETVPKAEVEGQSWVTQREGDKGHSCGAVPKEDAQGQEGYNWGTVPKEEEEGQSWETLPNAQGEGDEGHSWGTVPKEDAQVDEGYTWGTVPKQEEEGQSWGTLPKGEGDEGHGCCTVPKEDVQGDDGYNWDTVPKDKVEGPSWGTLPKSQRESDEGQGWGSVPKEDTHGGEGCSWGTLPKEGVAVPRWGTFSKAEDSEGHCWGRVPKEEAESSEGHSWGTVPKEEAEDGEGHSWGTVPKEEAEDGEGYSWETMPKEEAEDSEGYSWGIMSKEDPRGHKGYPLLRLPLEELEEEESEQKFEGNGPHLWVRSGQQLSRKT